MLLEFSLKLKIVWSGVVVSNGLTSIAIIIPFVEEVPLVSDITFMLPQYIMLYPPG
jgi:hypothetical protein